ncbi:MAG TPA: hypothetical protein PKO06_01505 [Candidatus Ozemobacteraceae bacterium]|nr:hypothetical protein [Candidatus Ozemobacteraceae bacterium]
MKRLLLGLCLLVAVLGVIDTPAFSQELTVYSMCPPRSLDWSNPRALMFTTAGNKLTFHHKDHKHSIGHVFIELKNGSERMLTGSVPTGDSNAVNKQLLLKEGAGLGILFADMPGRLENTPDLDSELPDRYKSGRIAFVTFKLSQATYDRVKNFIAEYKARGYDKIYNGLNDPRRGLGAGCGTFGMACLEVAGLLHPTWKNIWYRHIDIAERLIGGKLGGGKKVSVTDILAAGRWNRDGEPTRRLDLCDPNLVYLWINAQHDKLVFKQIHAGADGLVLSQQVTPEKRQKAKGLVYDCTHVKTPTEPIFLK